MNVDYRKALKTAKHLGLTTLRGLARAIYGATVAGLLGIAIYGFIAITAENGYQAVFDFIAACATLTVAMSNMYYIGLKKRGGKK